MAISLSRFLNRRRDEIIYAKRRDSVNQLSDESELLLEKSVLYDKSPLTGEAGGY